MPAIPFQAPADPLAAFEPLAANHSNCFLLETFDGDGHPGRAYIGVDPRHHFAVKGGVLYKNGRGVDAADPYAYLRTQLSPGPSLPESGYAGGLVGYASHEAYHLSEPSLDLPTQRHFSDLEYGLYDDGLIFEPGLSPRYFSRGKSRPKMYTPVPTPPAKLKIRFNQAHKDAARYHQMVEKARSDITEGRVFQAVLANKYEYDFEGDLLLLYKELRSINPSEYMFFIKFGDTVTMGASPELLLHVDPSRTARVEALAGTTRRGETARETEALGRKLLADEKERAEHSMLVDLVRNDLGRVSRIGSVRIEKLMYIKRLSHVQHICSLVSGELLPDRDAFHAMPAAFPTGTLVGAPKLEAAKMITELEASERGPYGGTVGYFSHNGDAMHAVNIRSVSAARGKLFMHSGSGIVYDSVPEREYDEISHKKAAMEKAMAPFMKVSAA